jgi:hypothetical protein
VVVYFLGISSDTRRAFNEVDECMFEKAITATGKGLKAGHVWRRLGTQMQRWAFHRTNVDVKVDMHQRHPNILLDEIVYNQDCGIFPHFDGKPPIYCLELPSNQNVIRVHIVGY